MTTTSGRYTSSRSSYSNTYGSSYTPKTLSSTTRATIGASTYPRTNVTSSGSAVDRIRERREEAAKKATRTSVDFSSTYTVDRYKPTYSRSYTSSTPSSNLVSRRYSTLSSSSSGMTSSSVTSQSEVVTEPHASVVELRKKFDCVSLTTPTNALTTNDNNIVNADEPDEVDDDELDDRSIVRGASALITNESSSTRVADKRGLNGLRNIGNTCFMNSVLQCLSNTKPLLEYLLDNKFESDINTTVSQMKGALIKAFGELVKELWAKGVEDKVVNTSPFKSQIQRFAPRFMGYLQQDAQEFLRYLLEGLHEDVNKVLAKPKPITTDIEDSLSDSQKANEAWRRYTRMEESKIMDIFVGQLKSTLQCTKCGHCSVTFDPFWDLSLPLPSRTGSLKLQACLDMFAKEEVLDGDEKPTCSKCQSRQKCTKKFSIQKFPRTLVLHLKRFSPTERFRGKLSNTVEFPLTGLDLSAYSAAKGLPCSYKLYAVSNHAGTTYSGHYTAYCRHPYTQQWHEYNDSRVSTISEKSVVSSEAYVLFYEMTSQSSHL